MTLPRWPIYLIGGWVGIAIVVAMIGSLTGDPSLSDSWKQAQQAGWQAAKEQLGGLTGGKLVYNEQDPKVGGFRLVIDRQNAQGDWIPKGGPVVALRVRWDDVRGTWIYVFPYVDAFNVQTGPEGSIWTPPAESGQAAGYYVFVVGFIEETAAGQKIRKTGNRSDPRYWSGGASGGDIHLRAYK